MENTDRAWLYPANFGWKDTDTWEAFYKDIKENEKDENGNYVFTGKSLVSEDKRCLIVSADKKKLYAIKGLEDFVVVDTDDALLICPRDDKKYKDLVSGLGMPGYEDFR
jgi:Mannose-1-phosphate guanylyltransferase